MNNFSLQLVNTGATPYFAVNQTESATTVAQLRFGLTPGSLGFALHTANDILLFSLDKSFECPIEESEALKIAIAAVQKEFKGSTLTAYGEVTRKVGVDHLTVSLAGQQIASCFFRPFVGAIEFEQFDIHTKYFLSIDHPTVLRHFNGNFNKVTLSTVVLTFTKLLSDFVPPSKVVTQS